MRIRTTAILLLAAAFSALSARVLSSWADTTEEYNNCQENCQATGCPVITSAEWMALGPGSQYEARGQQMPCSTCCGGPLHFGMVGLVPWTCQEDCDYLCQHETRLHWWADRVISYERKYHGRWTFDRVLGAHEIASVVFSFGNLVENVRCGLRCRRLHRRALSGAGKAASERDRWRMWLWRPSWYATLVAWHLSMWYHLKPRNRDASEMLDVTVAGSIPTMGFLFALAVTTDLGTPWLLRCIQGVLAAQVAHAASMFVWYDNARQLAWAVLVQVVQFPLWVRWVRSPEGRGHPARWRVFVFVGLMNVCFLFEAFDFGPIWRLFDAHAIWHLCTIPVVHFWYDFIEGDLVHMERKLNGKAGEDAAGPPAAPASRGEAGSGDEEAARPRRRGLLGGPRAGA